MAPLGIVPLRSPRWMNAQFPARMAMHQTHDYTPCFRYLCSAGTHDLCARERRVDGRDRVCGCPCHNDKQPRPPSDPMDLVRAFWRVLLAFLPFPIEPGWDPISTPRFAGFPVNILCADLRAKQA